MVRTTDSTGQRAPGAYVAAALGNRGGGVAAPGAVSQPARTRREPASRHPCCWRRSSWSTSVSITSGLSARPSGSSSEAPASGRSSGGAVIVGSASWSCSAGSAWCLLILPTYPRFVIRMIDSSGSSPQPSVHRVHHGHRRGGGLGGRSRRRLVTGRASPGWVSAGPCHAVAQQLLVHLRARRAPRVTRPRRWGVLGLLPAGNPTRACGVATDRTGVTGVRSWIFATFPTRHRGPSSILGHHG